MVRTDVRTDVPGDVNRHLPKFWLRPKNILTSEIISLIPHVNFAVSTHGDQPDVSAITTRESGFE